MVRATTAFLALLLVLAAAGCGGDDGEPVNIVGTWSGPMTHRIIDSNRGTDVTLHYTVTFIILSQEGSSVSGRMRLRDSMHVGNLRGTMTGSHFDGVRTGTHTVTIEFDVGGNTLMGTFRFVGDGLDETGTYTCTRL
jgi:hypothetical protein